MKNQYLFKFFVVIALCSVAMLISSCKSKPKVAQVKPESIEIHGAFKDYLEIIDNVYQVVDNWGGKLSIKIKAKEAAPEDLLKDKDFELKLSLLDENGSPVSGTKDLEVDYGCKEKIISLLANGSGEEVILFASQLGDYDAATHAEITKKFLVSSLVKDKEKPSVSTTDNTNDNSSVGQNTDNSDKEEEMSSSGSENWDQMLDDYEKYADEYIKFYKKAMKGDQNAMSEYPELMNKATALSASIVKAQNDNKLSTKQINRMVKIQSKMAKAVQNN